MPLYRPPSCLLHLPHRNSYHPQEASSQSQLESSSSIDTLVLPQTPIPCSPPSMWERTYTSLLRCIFMAPGIGFFHYPGNTVGVGTPSI